ncbi:aldo/keto reductase [Paenibacillus sp. FSL K6-2862]|uniref:aldo/keto reductase n=1 Tax=Paenibacillus sp. FSL K6-2862 TaxID=2921484 RepID=UPI0030F6075C
MDKRFTIGRTGIEVSRIGLGAGVVGNTMMYPKVTEDMGRELVQAAIEEGIDFIDTAFLYGFGRSEELIGEAIRNSGRRDKVKLSTKAAANFKLTDQGAMQVDNSPSALRESVEHSLTRLQTDYIDVFFVHYPYSDTPLEEAAGALADLKQEGKIKSIGASNLSYEQLQQFNMDGYMDVFQTEYSLLARQAETDLIPYCLEHQISVIPTFPLASGLLAGQYKKEDTFTDLSRMNNPMFQGEDYITNLERVERMKDYAAKKDMTLPQMALAWLLNRPGVDLIIPGATRPDQLRTNMRTTEVVLTDADMEHLDILSSTSNPGSE